MARKPSAGKMPAGIRWYAGRYQVRYYDARGCRVGKSFERLADAKRFQVTVRAAVQQEKVAGYERTHDGVHLGSTASSTPPFDEWAAQWLSSRLRQKSNSKQKNASLIDRHLIGDSDHGFGNRPIGSIKQQDIQGWVNWMSARYKPSYVRSAYVVLSGMFRTAHAAELIQRVPLGGIQLPPIPRKAECFLSEEECELMTVPSIRIGARLSSLRSGQDCDGVSFSGWSERS